MSLYVLDSFAILAYYLGEPGAAQVHQLMHERRHEHWMTEINLGEVFYKSMRERSEEFANELLEDMLGLPIKFVDADRALTMEAASLKGRFPLSYADCFAAALAQRLSAKLVTGDPEFERLERDGLVEIEWLTPKPKARRR